MNYDPRSYERNIHTTLETTKEKSNPLALILEFSLVMFSLLFVDCQNLQYSVSVKRLKIGTIRARTL